MRKTLVVLALAGALLSQPALLDSLWTLLTALWEESSQDAGCTFDPNGQCTPRPQEDAGCSFDPNGCPKGS